MKSTELKIGNKLQKSDGKIFTISRLDESNDVHVKEERGLLTLGYNLNGIPLTEKWLLEFGFENKKKTGFEKFELINGFEIYGDRNGLYWFNSCVLNSTNLKYVHQLQNLYFALTGEELEVKP